MTNKKRKKYRVNKKRIAILTAAVAGIVIATVFVTVNVMNFLDKEEPVVNKVTWESESKNVDIPENFDVIYESKNKNYDGKGQEKVEDNNEYFTTFTTREGKVYKEYKQNGIAPWAEKAYWGASMEESGCGITSLAIVLSGFGIDQNPEALREKYYPIMDYELMQEELINTFGIDATCFYYDVESLSVDRLKKHLKTGSPVIACTWGDLGPNRWTRESHYMVMLATDGKDKVYISNPNGLVNKSNSSGWYDFDEIAPFLVKVMFIGPMDYLGV